MDQLKLSFLAINMLQAFFFIECDIICYYLMFQLGLFALYKSNTIMTANIYSAFAFSIGWYIFVILYLTGFVKEFPTSFLAIFVCVFTNFILSLSFMEIQTSSFIHGECPICFEKGNLQQLSQCKHNFHTNCIRMWLRKQNSCPLCRTIVKC